MDADDRHGALRHKLGIPSNAKLVWSGIGIAVACGFVAIAAALFDWAIPPHRWIIGVVTTIGMLWSWSILRSSRSA